MLSPLHAAAQEDPDEFAFFQKEAEVVTASRRPSALAASPASVYVITSEDIRASGAQTIPDALRGAPGVDVMSERTNQADVSIRGMNTPLNNRTLVLLDGRTVLNGFFDFTNWDALPVTIDEVDRIEIVEGPTSALYGGNALHGVINIITKTPDQLNGGVVSYTGGERDYHAFRGGAGTRAGAHAWKLGTGHRTMSRFENRGRLASRVTRFNGLYSYDLDEDSRVSFSGGANDHDVNISNGPSYDDGRTGFLRADWRRRGTSARVFWNRGRSTFRDQPVIPIEINYDTVDASVERAFELPYENSLTAGAGARRNTARSNLIQPGLRDQSLYALFAENSWRASERWTFVASARADHHPFAGWQVAPRASAIFAPMDGHSLRATAASAFRNPTLLENYFDLGQRFTVNSPPFTAVDLTVVPNQDLEPERIQFFELAHRGTFDALRTTLAGYYYRVTSLVRTVTTTDLSAPPVATQISRVVNGGETKALGGEAGAELSIARPLKVYANYAYMQLYDQNSYQTSARSGPKHKVNAGARASHGQWGGSAELHWVGRTRWSDGTNASNPVLGEVRAYAMVNVAATRRFTGRWEGLSLTVAGFNVADRHYETLPRRGAASGQNGEIIGPRWTGTLAYRFGP